MFGSGSSGFGSGGGHARSSGGYGPPRHRYGPEGSGLFPRYRPRLDPAGLPRPPPPGPRFRSEPYGRYKPLTNRFDPGFSGGYRKISDDFGSTGHSHTHHAHTCVRVCAFV